MRKIYILFILLMSHYGGFTQDIKQHYLGFGYFGNVAEPDPYTGRYIWSIPRSFRPFLHFLNKKYLSSAFIDQYNIQIHHIHSGIP